MNEFGALKVSLLYLLCYLSKLKCTPEGVAFATMEFKTVVD
jgi:hypothetical protein